MFINEVINTLMNSPVRKIEGVVELYNSTALLDTYSYNGDLKEFTIDRTGEGKFFGYGIGQSIKVKIRDVNREKTPKAGDILKIKFEGLYFFPNFIISQVRRNELTNELSITAYDAINKSNKLTYKTLEMPKAYTFNAILTKIISALGLDGINFINTDSKLFDVVYDGNFDENEIIRNVLDDIAEATQSIYFLSNTNKIVFKTLDKSGAAVTTITKDNYFNLNVKDGSRLQTICKVTELGDNLTVSTKLKGSTQYIRDNGFWELREDIPALLNAALTRVGDLSIKNIDLSWRGNPLIELGDKVNITTKDNQLVTSFLLNDTLTYDGSLTEKTKWEYKKEEETETNPSNLGEVINQTFARVDKANKKIELVAASNKEALDKATKAETSATNAENAVAQLRIETDKISGTVSSYSQQIIEAEKKADKASEDAALANGNANAAHDKISNMETEVGSVKTDVGHIQDNIGEQNKNIAANKLEQEQKNKEIEERIKSAEAQLTDSAFNLKFTEELNKTDLNSKVTGVKTSTDYTFNDEGLNIGKSNSAISTQITNNGMRVSEKGNVVLTADNAGVEAVNLNASTWLIVGKNSRFEDYGYDRTGCFFIGGN